LCSAASCGYGGVAMNLIVRLPWLLVLIPLIEIFLLIEVGGRIGVLPTILLVIFTAILGINLVRHQGFSTFRRVQAMVERGEVPALELLEGLVLLIAGAFLLTPGFFTDTLAFLALVPSLRRRLLQGLIARGVFTGAAPSGGAGSRGARTIEGEFHRHDD